MIREATREDVPACVRLIRSAFLTVADAFGLTPENAPRFTAFAVTEDALMRQLEVERRPMFVWEENGEARGYYSLRMQGDGECELNHLAVAPEYRHRGIGNRLLDHAFSTARALGRRRMNIGIIEENARLRQWYENAGAIHTGTKKYDFFPFTCGYLTKEL